METQVKMIRQKLLLTQLEFSKKIGVSKQMISNYETKQNLPSMNMIKKLIELCRENNIEISADDFFKEKEIGYRV